MTKRPLDEGVAVIRNTVEQANGSIAKKRKTVVTKDGPEGTESRGSKEERREAKRLNKLQEAEINSQNPTQSKDVRMNASAGTEAGEKAARKARKSAKNVAKLKTGSGLDYSAEAPTAGAQIAIPNSSTNGKEFNGLPLEVRQEDKTMKAARKAEKAKSRALKKSEDTEATEATSRGRTGLPEDHIDGATTARNGARLSNGQPSAVGRKKHTSKSSLKMDKTQREAAKSSEVSKHGAASTNEHLNSLSDTSIYGENPTLASLPQSEIDLFLNSNFITVTDPISEIPLRPIMSFSHLPSSALLKPSLFSAFKNPTPIQSAAWPFLLAGRDVIGVAETGSGKTLAFGVPCVRHISSGSLRPTRGSSARAVIVSPTRELAVQIFDQLVQLADPAGLKAVCVYGGVPKDPQRQALKTAHIVVATPGRLNDLINEGAADLSNVDYVVLDEADRMLDKGFEDEIRKIISTTRSSGRQTLMFTATWPLSIRELASTFMRSPVKIAIGDNPTGELRANTSITQKIEVVSPYDKESRLLQLLKQHTSPSTHTRILVFCLYKKEASRIENFLRSKGFKVAGIHGDMSQEKRSASLEAFKRDKGTPILVATDVAARGLDIPAVKVVINVTFPLTVEDYVHRIGR